MTVGNGRLRFGVVPGKSVVVKHGLHSIRSQRSEDAVGELRQDYWRRAAG